MKIKAVYQGTATKAIRATKDIRIQCAKDPRVVHSYTKEEIIGAEPTNHHYTFGKPGDIVSGGFYVRVGAEVPEFLELHTEKCVVNLNDLGLILEIPKKEARV